jgi:hypothetical protein
MARPTPAQRHAVSRRAKLAIACGCALVALVAVIALPERPAQATSPITKVTITIDGSMADWAPVLANPLQTTRDGDGSSPAIVVDCARYSTDRDCPQTGGAGNDLQAFAWTFDDDAVYLYIERFATGQLGTGVDFFFVADVNRDGLVRGRLNQAGVPDDVAIHANWQPGSGAVTVKLADYVPANAAVGDAIACGTTQCGKATLGYVDGYQLPGNSSALRVCPSCSGAPNADKLHAELKIPWAAFGAGVSKDTPFNWHVLSANNARIDQAVDNIGAPDGKLGTFIERGVSLWPDRSGAALAGASVSYVHTLVNDGNAEDFFNFDATDAMAARVELWDGATRLGVDLEGDGVWDTVAANQDAASGDLRPDVSLAVGASKDVTVVLTLPARNGSDATRLTATSGNRTTVSATVTDSTYVGAPAFAPPEQTGYVIAGQALQLRQTLLNGQAVPDTFQLSATGCSGYSLALAADAFGAPGATIADTGPVAGGASVTFWLLVTPPSGKPDGFTCAVTVTAHSATSGADATSTNTAIISGPVALTPNHLGTSRARVASGASVFLPVILRNASSGARAFSLAPVATSPVAGVPPPRG